MLLPTYSSIATTACLGSAMLMIAQVSFCTSCQLILTAVHLLLYLNKFIKIPGFAMHPFASGGSILGFRLQLW